MRPIEDDLHAHATRLGLESFSDFVRAVLGLYLSRGGSAGPPGAG